MDNGSKSIFTESKEMDVSLHRMGYVDINQR